MTWERYQVGKVVACVNEVDAWAHYCSDWPRQGRIYTISHVMMGENELGVETLGLRFAEFVSFPTTFLVPQDGVWSFPAKFFQPLDDARLAPFRRLLDAPVPVTRLPSGVLA